MGCSNGKQTTSNAENKNGEPPQPQPLTPEAPDTEEPVPAPETVSPAAAAPAPETVATKQGNVADYFEWDALLASVVSGAVGAVRGTYIIELHKRGEKIRRRIVLGALIKIMGGAGALADFGPELFIHYEFLGNP